MKKAYLLSLITPLIFAVACNPIDSSPTTQADYNPGVLQTPTLQYQTVSGNLQTASAGAPLANSFNAVVTDGNGIPMPNIVVDWTISSGGGSLTAQSTTSDSNGLTSNHYMPGTTAGSKSVVATLHGTSTNLTFSSTITAAAVSPTLSSIALSAPSSAADGTTSTVSVTLVDAYGNPVNAKNVNLQTNRAANTDMILPPSQVSGADGKAIFTVSSLAVGFPTFSAVDSSDSLSLSQTQIVKYLNVLAVSKVPTAETGPGNNVLAD